VQPELFPLPGALSSAWGDYDNDGNLDLVVTYTHGIVRLYHNEGNGRFTDVSEKVGLGQIGDPAAMKSIEMRAASWGDYDGDGYLDLYIGTRNAEKQPSDSNRGYLFRNMGGATFADVAKDLGVDVPHGDARQVSFIDVDGDGRVDIFFADRSGPKHLFRNDGNGKFTDIAKDVGLTDMQYTVGVCWFDFDGDGRLDLFLANQDGSTDVLYHNVAGKFVDIAPALGMDHPHRAKDEGGVGCTVGDYDNDGKLDLFVAMYGENALYHNDGNGKFTDVSKRVGITGAGHFVGASWGDYDNDGLLDLFVSGYTHANEPADRLYRNVGGRFVDVIGENSALNASDHGVQWADYDRDGALDLTLTDDFSKTASRHTLLHNALARPRRGSSLQVMVLDAQGHATRAGSEVRLYDHAGKLLGTRLVATGDGYNSQGVAPVHFGVAADGPVTVEVTYFTNAGRRTQRMENVRPAEWVGKVLRITQR
jgi:hypothetical protein